MAVSAAGVGPGDEVLLSASTNVATALAVYHNGAICVPVDSEEQSWNLDLNHLENMITPNTKAIIPVHLFGYPVDMDALVEIAKKHSLTVIEDAAEAHGAECRGRKVGAWGHMACFSFYANKLITTGEGGMVLTDSDELADELRGLRNLYYGKKTKLLHEKAGYNFRMTGYQAAMGLAQLPKLEGFIERKHHVVSFYADRLGDMNYLQLPGSPEWGRHVYWMYGVCLRNGSIQDRDNLMEHLRKQGVGSRTFFCPVSAQPFLTESTHMKPVHCPVAWKMWETGLYLPSSTHLDEQDIDHVCDAVKSYFK